MKRIIKKISSVKILFTYVLLYLLLVSCTKSTEEGFDPSGDSKTSSYITITGSRSTLPSVEEESEHGVNKLRVIIFDASGKVEINQVFEATNAGRVPNPVVKVSSGGVRNIYAIANEDNNTIYNAGGTGVSLTSALNALKSIAELESLAITNDMRFTLPSSGLLMSGRAMNQNIESGHSVLNPQPIKLELVRMTSKVTVKAKLNNEFDNPVTITNFKLSRFHNNDLLLSTTPPTAVGVIDAQYTLPTPLINTTTDRTIATSYPGINNSATNAAQSPYLILDYKINNVDFHKEIQIVANTPFHVLRNVEYVVSLTFNNAEILVDIAVLPWNNIQVDTGVAGTYLNVSKSEVKTYDGSIARIYFETDAESIQTKLEGIDVDTKEPLNVDDYFVGLLPDGSNPAPNINIDPITKKGYIDIESSTTNLDASRSIYILFKTGNIEKKIYVARKHSDFSRTKNSIPCVGTFHRGSEVGERIITWDYTGAWNAKVDGPEAWYVMLDREPSPLVNSLYTEAPGDPEKALVTSDFGSVKGIGRIYFRVGWKSKLTTSTPRYATVVIREGHKMGEGKIIQTLYLRQGEVFDEITGDALWPVYNVDQVGAFTGYPSQVGYYYQFSMDQLAYSPVGDVNINMYANTSSMRSVCPVGYVTPTFDVSKPLGSKANVYGKLQNLPQEPIVGGKVSYGYYADGYFDRRSITTFRGRIGVNQSSNLAAAVGQIRYNPSTLKSLFFPGGGIRQNGIADLLSPNVSMYRSSTGLSTTTMTQVFSTIEAVSGARLEPLTVRCVKGYTIKYDLNAQSANYKLADGDNTKYANVPYKLTRVYTDQAAPAFEFKGWSLKSDLSAPLLANEQDVTDEMLGHSALDKGEITLYAVWNRVRYTILWWHESLGTRKVTTAKAGERVYLTQELIDIGKATTNSSGYQFLSWKYGSTHLLGTSDYFYMPAEDVTVSANFIKLKSITVINAYPYNLNMGMDIYGSMKFGPSYETAWPQVYIHTGSQGSITVTSNQEFEITYTMLTGSSNMGMVTMYAKYDREFEYVRSDRAVNNNKVTQTFTRAQASMMKELKFEYGGP